MTSLTQSEIKEARRLYNKQYYEKNKEQQKEKRKEYVEKNKELIKEKAKLRYEANKEKIKEQVKKYREVNQNLIKERAKKHYDANAEALKQWQKEYREANKEMLLEEKRQYYIENKEKIQERKRVYRHAHRDGFATRNKRRHERLVAQSDKSITPDFVTELFKKAKSCPYCGNALTDNPKNIELTKTLDHLIPLSKGGLHSQHNVVVCCYSCNSKKGVLDFSKWLERLHEPYRTNSRKLYIKKHGVLPEQVTLPLMFNK